MMKLHTIIPHIGLFLLSYSNSMEYELMDPLDYFTYMIAECEKQRPKEGMFKLILNKPVMLAVDKEYTESGEGQGMQTLDFNVFESMSISRWEQLNTLLDDLDNNETCDMVEEVEFSNITFADSITTIIGPLRYPWHTHTVSFSNINLNRATMFDKLFVNKDRGFLKNLVVENITGTVISMQRMFYESTYASIIMSINFKDVLYPYLAFKDSHLPQHIYQQFIDEVFNQKTSSITHLQQLFYNSDIEKFCIHDVSMPKVVDISEILAHCNKLRQVELVNVDLSQCTGYVSAMASNKNLVSVSIINCKFMRGANYYDMFARTPMLTSLEFHNNTIA